MATLTQNVRALQDKRAELMKQIDGAITRCRERIKSNPGDEVAIASLAKLKKLKAEF